MLKYKSIFGPLTISLSFWLSWFLNNNNHCESPPIKARNFGWGNHTGSKNITTVTSMNYCSTLNAREPHRRLAVSRSRLNTCHHIKDPTP